MINSLKRYITIGAAAALIGALASSCSEDDLFSPDSGGEGDSYITFRCADMLETFVGEHNPASRAGGSKNPEEKAINTLHVFFFDNATGELLVEDTYSNFRPYQKLTENTSMLKMPTGAGVSDDFKQKYKNVHIVAIANIDATDQAETATDAANKFYTEKYSSEGKIEQAGRNGETDPYEIKNYSDLQKWVYYPRIRMSEDGTQGDISKLPEAGMPMIGELRGIDLSQKPATTPIVNMQALMAKVIVTVKLDPDQEAPYGDYPLLKITGYGVRNMPIAVPFKQPTAEVNDGYDRIKPIGATAEAPYGDYFERYNVTNAPVFHNSEIEMPTDPFHFVCKDEAHEFLTSANVTINRDSEAVTFTYYTFENINLPDYNAVRANGDAAFNDALQPQYPDGVKDADKQRWKSTFAYSDRASAMILKGEYTTHQGLTYKAQFTVYLGCTVGVADPNIDFQVKRNHRYDNNIVIHGLDYIRNSADDVYNFDGRVNVVDDNPFYLAIVNERKVDAHATALPMDVWFMLREDGNGNVDDVPWNSEITFTVRNHEQTDWIRMEKVTRAQMEQGDFEAGTGARDYFTTDLVTNTLKDSYSITIDGDTDGSRSRIYFYIDENVPESNNPNNYGDRMATIDIEYVRKDENDNTVDRRIRTLEIEQRALLKVTGGKNNTSDAWIEYYEEYLEHNDPLDKHTMDGELYTGLPWGKPGVDYYSFPGSVGINNYAQGFEQTKVVVNNSGTGAISSVKLFNTEAPESAFHYCYGKNKRNNAQTGTVDSNITTGWYLPAITELENALLQYYQFEEFRGNFYWSAASAKRSLSRELNTHARATRLISVPAPGSSEEPKYAESGSTNNTDNYTDQNGTGGRAPRETKLRIRAFYRAQ